VREPKAVSNEDLMRMSRKRPSTLYEMKALEELARRATRGQIDLSIAIELTVEACRFHPPIFSGSPGVLAAAVFNGAEAHVASAFWAMARERLDALSLEVLESAFP
jgi:hypothetical protein